MVWIRVSAWFAALCLTTTALAGDWPQFLGPNRNAASAETGLLQAWDKKGPPVLWKKEVGEGFSGPVIAGDRLILFHRVKDEDVVECLDPATGKEKWKFAYPTAYEDDYGKGNGPRSTPAIAATTSTPPGAATKLVKHHVYTLSADGKLHCLELETGNKVWDRSVNKEYGVKKGFFGVATSPIVVAGKVIVNVGGPEAGIVAFDAATGKEAWKATKHEAGYSSPIAFTQDGVNHVAFFTREGLAVLDPASGQVRFEKRWRARILASVNAAVPVLAGDLLFVSSSYQTGAIVHRVSKDKFTEVWSGDDSLSCHYNTPVHKDGFLFGIDGRQEGGAGRLRCVEAATGKVRWSEANFGCASIILADGNLIALNENGELLLIEATPAGYKEKARSGALLRSPCRAELALSNGRLFARDPATLICWNLRSP